MTPDRANLQDALLRSSEIADMLGVNLAAVSNFKKRHADFPEPAYQSGKTTLYWTEDVVAWIDKRYGGIDKVAENLEAKATNMKAQAEWLRGLGGN